MILVIDNYDSFTYNLVHLVERVTRSYTVVRNDEVTTEEVEQLTPNGILISPGPGRPENAGISEEIIRKLGAVVPILGVCLGHQAIASAFGGHIVEAPVPIHGKTSCIRHDGLGVFTNLPQNFVATRYHSLVVDPYYIPKELIVSATSDCGVIMGLRHKSFPIEGVQFHPESILSVEGPAIVANWVEATTPVSA
ncbi:MAG: aminodeoxychorismate/anthranilate synthase component II [Rubricoccaceae bacterium]|nr:aminodeoxychorismate/anthranilate synthase component II [Rubricoccaceae bacterium]